LLLARTTRHEHRIFENNCSQKYGVRGVLFWQVTTSFGLRFKNKIQKMGNRVTFLCKNSQKKTFVINSPAFAVN